jgi:hypothetical protein
MGTLLRSALRDEVNKNLGGRDEGKVEPGITRINRALDLAQLRIARKRDFRELFILDTDNVVVTGTPATDAIYTGMPSTFRDIYGLVYQETASATAYPLSQMLPRQWHQLISAPLAHSTQERPTHYIIWGSATGGKQIEWYPIPDQNFLLTRRYSKWPDRDGTWVDGVAADLDDKDDIIIALATHHLFLSLGQKEDAATWYAVYKDLMKDAEADNAHQPDMATRNRGISSGAGLGPRYYEDAFVREDP